MKKIASFFIFSLLAVSVTFLASCNKDQPAPPPSCDGFGVVVAQQGNDQLIANATGGSTPYTYLWTGGETTQVVTVDSSLIGDYGVTVTDANGCTAENTFSITSNPCANFHATIGLDGSVLSASHTEGTAPFTYAWNTSATTSSISVDLNVPADYSVTITDANGCSASADFSITSSTPCDSTDLSIAFEYNPNPAGNSLTALGTGGTAPYSYQWNNGIAGDVITGVTTGTTYSATITDANGCTAMNEYTVPTTGCGDFAVDIIKNDSITTAIFFEATTTAGTSPFTYLWGGSATGTSSYVELPNGTSGSVSVTVTDANGCTVSDTEQF